MCECVVKRHCTLRWYSSSIIRREARDWTCITSSLVSTTCIAQWQVKESCVNVSFGDTWLHTTAHPEGSLASYAKQEVEWLNVNVNEPLIRQLKSKFILCVTPHAAVAEQCLGKDSDMYMIFMLFPTQWTSKIMSLYYLLLFTLGLWQHILPEMEWGRYLSSNHT